MVRTANSPISMSPCRVRHRGWSRSLFQAAGYDADRRFNALQGDRRMIFHGPAGKVDVFVGVFEMCHRLDLSPRLELERDTLTASDLLMTKLQVVEVNQKDIDDTALLLSEHELDEGPGDHIDLAYLRALVYDDWGLWRTATGTLETVAQRLRRRRRAGTGNR